jgi:hypothetical protein
MRRLLERSVLGATALLCFAAVPLRAEAAWILWSPTRPGAQGSQRASYDSRGDCLQGADSYLRSLHPDAALQETVTGGIATFPDGQDGVWVVIAECWPEGVKPDWARRQRQR